MAQEQSNLNWHTYSDHLKEMMFKLMESSNETADVTLMCDDKIQFKAHKYVLSASSSFFHSIINELPKKGESVIYLKGIISLEMQSILQFIYLGQATIYQNKMNDFLNVAKDLEIKAISKEVYDENEKVSKNYPKSHDIKNENEDTILQETDKKSEKFTEGIKETEVSIAKSFMNGSDLLKCMKCDTKFKSKNNILRHVKNMHDRLRNFHCNECDKSFNQNSDLIKHVQGIHEGVKFPCNECPYKATTSSNLSAHRKKKH